MLSIMAESLTLRTSVRCSCMPAMTKRTDFLAAALGKSPKELGREFHLPVADIYVVKSQDHEGQPSYEVWVAFSNDATEKDFTSKTLSSLDRHVRDGLYKASEYTRFPYISFAKKREVPAHIKEAALSWD